MTHGTIPWEGSDERRTLFYKYVPYGMHHADACYDVDDPELTLQQREILEFSETWFNEPRGGGHREEMYGANPGMTRMHPLATAGLTRKHGRRVPAKM